MHLIKDERSHTNILQKFGHLIQHFALQRVATFPSMFNEANTFIVHRYLIKVVRCKLHGEDHMHISVSNVSVYMSGSTLMLTCLQISLYKNRNQLWDNRWQLCQ